MSTSNQYRQRVRQAQEKIAHLQRDKGNLAKRAADLQSRISSASQAVNRTNSESTIRSKLREIEQKTKDLATTEGKIADVEGKLAAEQKRLSDAQQSLAKEEERESQKRQRDADRAARQHENRMRQIHGTLAEHESLHRETCAAIEQLSKLPERIVVLFLASNPLDQQQLRLDEEARAIQEMIRKSQYRDSVKLESRWAVRPMDVLQAINEHKPAIVHFSGHGSKQDEIVFQDEAGKTKLVSKEAIVQVMRACSGDIRLVFFNTCYSRNQAEEVVAHVEAAVGMNTSIGDEAARVFASQFYSAIGFGKSVARAFEQAKALLLLEGIREEDTPELFVANAVDAESLVIVRPHDDESDEALVENR